jgi:Protein of unknown function (DUF2510)
MDTRTAKPNAPAGWYPDPDGFGQQRYWDGSAWTDRYATSGSLQASTDDRRSKLVFWGWVAAILAWPAGIVLGIILVAKRLTRSGMAILVVSVLWGVIWNLVFFNAVFGEGDTPSASGAIDAAYLEDDLPQAFLSNSQGDLENVECLESSGTVYRCSGEYEPTRSEIREQFRGNKLTPADIDALLLQQTGEVGIEVTVDLDEGSYRYEFSP